MHIVFGGHSPIAIECAKRLSQDNSVFLVTRCINEELEVLSREFSNIHMLEADISKKHASSDLIDNLYSQGHRIQTVCFFQRYRCQNQEEYCFSDHCMVEIHTIEAALSALIRNKLGGENIKIIVSSSPAASKVLGDQDLNYHIIKSGQEALVRFCGSNYRKYNISVIGIRIGSVVIKERARVYWDSIYGVLESLKKVSPSGFIQTSTDVGTAFADLAMSRLNFLSGQILSVDDGFDLLDSIQLAKHAFETDGD